MKIFVEGRMIKQYKVSIRVRNETPANKPSSPPMLHKKSTAENNSNLLYVTTSLSLNLNISSPRFLKKSFVSTSFNM